MTTRTRGSDDSGFSLIEVLLVLAIMTTIAGIAIPVYAKALERARMARAIGDIKALDTEIRLYEITKKKLPKSLADIGRENLRDPWGNAYQYFSFEGAKGKGGMRKDRFLVPLNSDYDLYSMGPDGDSKPPLTASVSRDDIIRAADGGFVGVASDY